MIRLLAAVAVMLVAVPASAAGARCNKPLEAAITEAHTPGWVKDALIGAAALPSTDSAIAALDNLVTEVGKGGQGLPAEAKDDPLGYVKCTASAYVHAPQDARHKGHVDNIKAWLAIR